MTLEELKKKLQAKAGTKVASDNDDFNAYDYSGGNYDDAFDQGQRDGEVQYARELLALLG